MLWNDTWQSIVEVKKFIKGILQKKLLKFKFMKI